MSEYLELTSHDAFRYGGGLNKSAADVYCQLLHGPMSAKQLVLATGRGRATVYRVLRRMAAIIDNQTGEVVAMVEQVDGRWHARTGADLDRVALLLGTAGMGIRKRTRYLQERREHRRSLGAGRVA